MTFLELQDRTLGRLNLTTQDARDRIKDFLNERVRAIQTSCNLGRTRRGSREYELLANDPFLTTSGTPGDPTTPEVLKVLNVRIPSLNRTLMEVTEHALMDVDPDESQAGPPYQYAVIKVNATNVTLRFWPIQTESTIIEVDGILTGVDLVDDADVPNIPEDFHDAIIFGALMDEYYHFDKPDRGNEMEKKYNRRVSEVRYFIEKSRLLHRNGGSYAFPDGWFWFYGSPWYTP